MARKTEIAFEKGGLSLAAKRLLAIAAYYIVLAIVLVLTWRFAAVRQLFTGMSLADLATDVASLTRDAAAVPRTVAQESIALQVQSTLFVLGGALVAAIPVAWSYSLTRRRRGFEQSMVHILVLLPVAVAGMVALIQNSLALAFSLAGIVAVLRFRNALEDVKDGVYIFVCVAIGISSALGALTIGLLTSLLFNASVIVLWWLDFARRPTPGIRGGIRKLMRLPRVHLPRLPNERRPITGDGDDVFAATAQVWRSEVQFAAKSGHKGHVTVSLRVLTPTPDETRPLVEAVLRNRARHWRLIGIVPAGVDTFTLKYRVSVRRSERDELLDAVRSASRVVGVEVR